MKRFSQRVRIRTHLKTEIFSLICFVCVLQGIVIGFVTSRIYSQQIFDRERDNLVQLLNVVNQDLNSRVDHINTIAFDIVINNEIKSNLNMKNELDAGRSKSTIDSILSKKFLSASDVLTDLSIIDLRNNTYSTRATYFLDSQFSVQSTDEYRIAETSNGALVWLDHNGIIDRYAGDSIFPASHLPGLRGVALIRDYSFGKDLGLLMISVPEDLFYKVNYSNSKLKDVSMFMVSPSEKTILPVAGSEGSLSKDILSQIDWTKGKGTLVIKGKEGTLVSYVRNSSMGWTLVSTISSSKITNSFSYIIRTLIIIIALSVLSSVVVSWWLSSIMARGIGDLAEKMKLVEQGNFDVHIDSKRSDELGSLARAFDQMVRNIKRLIETSYRQELLAKEIEFKTLQAQINPHFLYNTLDMINWRLLAKADMETSQSIVQLGQILQYSMSEKVIVSLADELQNVENYLALRKSNRDPDFSYSIKEIDGERVRLPKLSLQPIVENSIIHGFAGRSFGNVLLINAFPAQNNSYCVEISDNGIGIEESEIDPISRLDLPGSDKVVSKSTRYHIGIKNVDQRIKYLYGETFGVSVYSQYGLGTKVEIFVPINCSAISASEFSNENRDSR